MSDLRVVGIDPAPAKGLDILDGAFRHIPPEQSAAYMADLATEDDVLVCWDAPLTGPALQALEGGAAVESDFTQRPIEKFFSRGKTGFKKPDDISVLGYAGCPHWTITRSLLGLPRVGPWDVSAGALPFALACNDTRRPGNGRHVVEVHPAVAIWLWCRDRRGPSLRWTYKKDDEVFAEVLIALENVAADHDLPPAPRRPKDDDELDAWVAYMLGVLWSRGSDRVVLLGNLELGTFLLPAVDGLIGGFERFVQGLKS